MGKPAVGLTLDPKGLERATGVWPGCEGVNVEIAEFGDLVAEVGAARLGKGRRWNQAGEDKVRVTHGLPHAEFPQPLTLAGQEIAVAAMPLASGFTPAAEQAREHIPEIRSRLRRLWREGRLEAEPSIKSLSATSATSEMEESVAPIR